MDEVSNGQRALWTTLIGSLASPFLTALIVMLLSVIAGLAGRGPDSLKQLDSAGQIAWAAEKSVAAFAWSAIPATVCAVLLAGLVLVRGTFSWIEAAIAGAVVISAAAYLTGGIIAQHITPIAFIAALVAVIMWSVLSRAGIIKG